VATKRYLLVDAYNVIHAVPALRARLADGLDAARDALAEAVRAIRDAEDLHAVVVLDSGGDRVSAERPAGEDRFEFLYAPAALSADGVIERLAARAGSGAEVVVASADRMVRESVRASGGTAITPEELMEWARGCERRLAEAAARRRAENARQWRHGIDL
jgi:predicted RNA-binding protein with PIN domain